MKGLMRVEAAAFKAYEQMPEEFTGLDLVREARILCGRPYCYEDTFFRALRKLRSEGVIHYECTNHINSFYKKVPKYEDKLQLNLFKL